MSSSSDIELGSGSRSNINWNGSSFEDAPRRDFLLDKGKGIADERPRGKTQFELPARGTGAGETFTLEATREPVHIEIFELHGGKFRQDADHVNDDLKRSVEDTFCLFKTSLVDLGICTKEHKVDIDVDNRIVWMCNADGTGVESKDLNALIAADPTTMQGSPELVGRPEALRQVHSDMQSSVAALSRLAKQVWPNATKRPAVSAGRKAPDNASPVSPSHLVSQSDAYKFTPCAKEALKIYEAATGATRAQQESVLNAMVAAETVIYSMEESIESELEAQRSNLNNAQRSNPPNEAAAKIARDAIELLEKHARADRLGLYVALAFISSIDLDTLNNPETALAYVDQVAAQIQAALQKYLDEKHEKIVNKDVYTGLLHPVVPDFMRGTPNLNIRKDETYAKWAAALAYSVLSEELARMGASNYWLREQSSAFGDTSADGLMLLITRKRLDGSAVVSTPLLDKMHADIASQSRPFAAAHPLQSLKDGITDILASAPAAAATTMDARVDAMAAQYHFDRPII